MPRDPDDVERSDLAYLEGRLLRVESEQKAIRRIHGELSEEVERLNQAVSRLRKGNDEIDPWRETTDVRRQRTIEMESLRARAREADEAQILLEREKGAFLRKLAIIAPAIGTLLYALAEFIRSFVHH